MTRWLPCHTRYNPIVVCFTTKLQDLSVKTSPGDGTKSWHAFWLRMGFLFPHHAARRLWTITGVDRGRPAGGTSFHQRSSLRPLSQPGCSNVLRFPADQQLLSTAIRLLSARSRWMGYAKIEILPHAPLGRRPAGSIFLQVVITTWTTKQLDDFRRKKREFLSKTLL